MPTSRKVILLLNILLIVFIYAWFSSTKDAVMMELVLSIYHTGINLALAIVSMLIAGIQRLLDKDYELFLSLGLTFLLSTVLVAVLSFPTCLIVSKL